MVADVNASLRGHLPRQSPSLVQTLSELDQGGLPGEWGAQGLGDGKSTLILVLSHPGHAVPLHTAHRAQEQAGSSLKTPTPVGPPIPQPCTKHPLREGQRKKPPAQEASSPSSVMMEKSCAVWDLRVAKHW